MLSSRYLLHKASNIWTEMATLIKTNNAVDLIVGEPDYPIEPFVKDTII